MKNLFLILIVLLVIGILSTVFTIDETEQDSPICKGSVGHDKAIWLQGNGFLDAVKHH